MKCLLIISAVFALVAAKPELYKEKEDFQYSRSSTDEGSKAGYYGAQRGNMGGNYEKAHNMDLLAQHQMSGLVKQVDGELGDGANSRTGSVYTGGNSRGIYGSGRYDLSGLKGRNFQETDSSFGNTHSDSSWQNSGFNSYAGSESSAYTKQAQNSRYQAGQLLHNTNAQALDHVLNSDSQSYGNQGAQRTGYHSQAGYDSSAAYNSAYTNQYRANNANTYGSNLKTHLITGSEPARIIIRPGSTITVPIAAQTYDASHISSAHDQNSIASEAEVLNSAAAVPHSNIPVTGPKHYESSYSYRKEWERHHNAPVEAVPLAIPTENPFASHSDLPDNSQALNVNGNRYQASGLKSHSAYSNTQNSAYDSRVRSSNSRQSGYNTNYGSQSSNLNTDAYTHGAYNAATAAVAANQVGGVDTKPKSWQSSYSYHKSWERQGDPYIIYPATNGNGVQSERLTANAEAPGYSSHQYGSHYAKKNQRYTSYGSDDCDENGHIRVARSADQNQYAEWNQQSQNLEDLGQYNQNLEELGQETQNLQDFKLTSQNLEDLGQQTQDLYDFKQYNQNLEDLGQQTQNLQDFRQHSDNLEDLGQQTQNLQNFGHYRQNLENLDQQSQRSSEHKQESSNINNHDNFGSLPNLSQQTWQDQQTQINSDDQQSQGSWNLQKNQGSWNDQQSNWHDAEDQQQHTQGLWSINSGQQFHNFDTNSGNSWQFSDHHISQSSQGVNTIQNSENSQNVRNNVNSFVSQNTDQAFDNTQHNGVLWSYSNHQTQQNNKHMHSSHSINSSSFSNTQFEASNSSLTGTRGSHSLQNLWNKIDKLDQNNFSSLEHNNSEANQSNVNHIGSNNINAHEQYGTSSTTKKPTTTVTTVIENNDFNRNRPEDKGRGDIDDEELRVPTDEVSKPIEIYHANNKPFKTPEEIETLSLTKENKTNAINSGRTSSNQDDYKINKTVKEQNSEGSLRVLTIDEQRQAENSYNKLHTSTTSQHQSDVTSSSNQETINNSQLKPKTQQEKTEDQNTDQQFENQGFVVQQNENLDQQQQNSWGQNLQDFNQQEQAVWKPSDGHQNYYDGQHRISDSTQQLEEFSQQNYSPREDTDHDLQQQSNTQQLESFGRSNHEQSQSQDFYSHRYLNANEKLIEHPKDIQSLQSIPSAELNEKEVEISTTSEPSTEKPSFWKSVGNKFSNAKEKVVSWWKS